MTNAIALTILLSSNNQMLQIVIYQNSCYQQQLREQNTFTSLFGQFATAELKCTPYT